MFTAWRTRLDCGTHLGQADLPHDTAYVRPPRSSTHQFPSLVTRLFDGSPHVLDFLRCIVQRFLTRLRLSCSHLLRAHRRMGGTLMMAFWVDQQHATEHSAWSGTKQSPTSTSSAGNAPHRVRGEENDSKKILAIRGENQRKRCTYACVRPPFLLRRHHCGC